MLKSVPEFVSALFLPDLSDFMLQPDPERRKKQADERIIIRDKQVKKVTI